MSEKQFNENQLLVQRIATLLNAGFHGGAWHGPSLMEAIKGIDPKVASHKMPTVHTIAELIYHITSWRIFAIKRLQGDMEYQIDTPQKDFGQNPRVDSFELETLLMELSLSHDELLRELQAKDDDFLFEIVPGSEYDYYTLIHGIIQHDIYHTGQINLLKKMSSAELINDDSEIEEGYFDDGLGDSF
ncbi:DinB family protein [Marinilongibacter aquaticus]|uniref:DinB family protein n=1 Tax=Marinilongibacter aquaticus TaxID=2975157 RepID=UPI0021BD3C19|nr:DinB family protein [Marinilongibacter aquaticus]UBM58837.1 DinB family protein [Marinilongibacter aquaticus]